MNTYTGVAIGGKAGAGKTRFAHEVVKELSRRGYDSRHFAFGNYVKGEVWELFELRKSDVGGRGMLIKHGMEMRQADPDYWVKKLAADWGGDGVPVICDVRFHNEYDWAKSAGMLLVRIDATVMDRSAALYQRGEDVSLSYSDHPSETELDEATWDLRWWNPHGGVIQLQKLACLTADAFTGIESAA